MRYYTFMFGSPHSSGLEDHASRSDGSLAPGGSAKQHICIPKNDRGGKVFFLTYLYPLSNIAVFHSLWENLKEGESPDRPRPASSASVCACGKQGGPQQIEY